MKTNSSDLLLNITILREIKDSLVREVCNMSIIWAAFGEFDWCHTRGFGSIVRFIWFVGFLICDLPTWLLGMF